MFDLKDRVALVTGGSRGIGRACCVALAKQGAYVAINYSSNESAAAQTLDVVRAAGGDGEIIRFDVADPEACDQAVTDLVKRKGRLDILVNNAGIAMDQLLIRIKPEELEKTFSTNVAGSLWCAKAAMRPMMKAKRGRIINLSSVVAESGNPGQAVYSASKAALLGLTKTLAREYASRGVTVNAVAPGFIETDMTSSLPEQAKQAIVAQTPLGRQGTAEEVAAAVVFLASDEASYVTGQTIRVNGGMYV
ncbi:3-oxoacyl-[acyl-carrier-protein] reductase [Sandaracinus amylolyticus]|uniref:3-oxoacyl-[acyl-carrier-protein] reductase n=1 Tax=Sandaracinus amylolyticus TaxID=927083 RepID=A0A0F6YJZ0_9BACT|nr:3-oxoacyl-[acyl-carrier-protein] reductase [Sandaracinus amylolyticus]AKF06738.1 3-oxoacyl-[acyl-carrier protein] reductase [Sandaracinus amylolyticus]